MGSKRGRFLLGAPLLLAACSTMSVDDFARLNALPQKQGQILAIHDEQDRVVGWLYGSVHYGFRKQPTLSREALETMLKTRHVYTEIVDGTGQVLDMRTQYADAIGLTEFQRPKMDAATLLAYLRKYAADKTPRDAAYPPAYYPAAASYCELSMYYGTESAVYRFLAQRDVVLHPMETLESRRQDKATADVALRSEPKSASKAKAIDDELVLPKDEAELQGFCKDVAESINSYSLTGLSGSTLRRQTAKEVSVRNYTMVEALDAGIKRGEMPFAIAGNAHLQGEASMQEILERKGYRVKVVGGAQLQTKAEGRD